MDTPGKTLRSSVFTGLMPSSELCHLSEQFVFKEERRSCFPERAGWLSPQEHAEAYSSREQDLSWCDPHTSSELAPGICRDHDIMCCALRSPGKGQEILNGAVHVSQKSSQQHLNLQILIQS